MNKDISCEACGFRFRERDKKRLHSHHIRPKEHGGSDGYENRITLCPNCHSIAHILISVAMDSFGLIDVYLYYERDFLVYSILRYTRVSSRNMLWRAWHAFLINTQLRVRYSFRLRDADRSPKAP
jgi:HNH endonuclease